MQNTNYASELINRLDVQHGLVLLDTQMRPLGAVAMTDAEMATLREDCRARRLMQSAAPLREQGLNVEPSSSRRCATCVPRH